MGVKVQFSLFFYILVLMVRTPKFSYFVLIVVQKILISTFLLLTILTSLNIVHIKLNMKMSNTIDIKKI